MSEMSTIHTKIIEDLEEKLGRRPLDEEVLQAYNEKVKQYLRDEVTIDAKEDQRQYSFPSV